MPTPSQLRKQLLGMSGEFLVAGELMRRGFESSVSYGNAKKSDIIVFSKTKFARIEVKTTSSNKWVLGSCLPKDPRQIWILVYLPTDVRAQPEYVVLSGAEIVSLLMPSHRAYIRKYKLKHGRPPTGRGVFSLLRTSIPAKNLGAWNLVRRAFS